jgi:TolA-binding protein
VERATTRARALLDAGEGTDARALLDSLLGVLPRGTMEQAEALFWRAVMAERVNEAERDWKRLVIEVPLSPRAPDALIRLGELDMLRGHPAEARVYFARLLRDFPSGSYRTKGLLWLTRSYFDERNTANGCRALDSLRGVEIPDGELRLQSTELQRRCTSAMLATPSPSPSPSPSPAPAAADRASGRYSVQLAAYDTRAEAEEAMRRFVAQSIDVRIDGTEKPFRVRTGYYATRSAANAALAALKKRGHDGFVAERAR